MRNWINNGESRNNQKDLSPEQRQNYFTIQIIQPDNCELYYITTRGFWNRMPTKVANSGAFPLLS